MDCQRFNGVTTLFSTRPAQRQHPFQSPGFWLLIGLGAALLGAWKFDLLPLTASHDLPYPLIEEELPPPTDRPGTEETLLAPELIVDAPLGNANPNSGPQPEIELASYEAHLGLEMAPVPESAPTLAADDNPPSTVAANTNSPLPTDPLALLQHARELRQQGDGIGAHRIFSGLYWQHPELLGQFNSELEQLAHQIYFQNERHYLPPHLIGFGDRLESIAREYDVTWEYLAKLNHLDPHRIKSGQSLKVLQGPFSAIVDQDHFSLTVHAYGYYVKRYQIGVGRDGATPVGTYRVVDKLTNPTYYGPDGTISDSDPRNPLGEHWLAINDAAGTLSGYGIHGTNEPNSIGKAESRGCIRLGAADVQEVFDLLTVGSEVVIRPQSRP